MYKASICEKIFVFNRISVYTYEEGIRGAI